MTNYYSKYFEEDSDEKNVPQSDDGLMKALGGASPQVSKSNYYNKYLSKGSAEGAGGQGKDDSLATEEQIALLKDLLQKANKPNKKFDIDQDFKTMTVKEAREYERVLREEIGVTTPQKVTSKPKNKEDGIYDAIKNAEETVSTTAYSQEPQDIVDEGQFWKLFKENATLSIAESLDKANPFSHPINTIDGISNLLADAYIKAASKIAPGTIFEKYTKGAKTPYLDVMKEYVKRRGSLQKTLNDLAYKPGEVLSDAFGVATAVGGGIFIAGKTAAGVGGLAGARALERIGIAAEKAGTRVLAYSDPVNVAIGATKRISTLTGINERIAKRKIPEKMLNDIVGFNRKLLENPQKYEKVTRTILEKRIFPKYYDGVLKSDIEAGKFADMAAGVIDELVANNVQIPVEKAMKYLFEMAYDKNALKKMTHRTGELSSAARSLIEQNLEVRTVIKEKRIKIAEPHPYMGDELVVDGKDIRVPNSQIIEKSIFEKSVMALDAEEAHLLKQHIYQFRKKKYLDVSTSEAMAIKSDKAYARGMMEALEAADDNLRAIGIRARDSISLKQANKETGRYLDVITEYARSRKKIDMTFLESHGGMAKLTNGKSLDGTGLVISLMYAIKENIQLKTRIAFALDEALRAGYKIDVGSTLFRLGIVKLSEGGRIVAGTSREDKKENKKKKTDWQQGNSEWQALP